MTETAERHYLAQMAERGIVADRLAGIAVTRHGYGRPTRRIEVVEAGHPVPDEAGARRDRARARARRRRRRGRFRRGAPLRRRLGQLDRAGRGPHARREAGGDARAFAQRRQHRRDQHGPQAPLAHQGRPAGPPRPTGPKLVDAGDLRRARRRSRRHRFGSDRARSDHAGRCPRYRPQIPPCPAGRSTARSRRSGKRDRRSQAIGSSPTRTYRIVARPADALAAARTRARGRRATSASCSATACRARPERSPPSTPRLARELCRAGPPHRHPVGRRTDRHAARARPRRPQPGIRAGACHRAGRRARDRRARRRYRRHRWRQRPRPTTRPGPLSTTLRSLRARRPASIPPRFSPTTIHGVFQCASATYFGPARLSPT